MRQRPRFLTALLIAPVATATLLGSSPAAAAAPAGPSITLRSSSSATSTKAESITVAKPAGALAGDVLVARVANQGNVRAQMTAPGWTVVGATNSAAMLKVVLLTKVLTGAEPATYTFDVSVRSNVVVSVSAFDNVDTADPVDSSVGRVNGFAKVFRTPTVVPTGGNELAVWFGTQLYAGSDCGAAGITPPAGMSAAAHGCLASPEGLAFTTAYRQLGAPTAHPGWVGHSDFPRTNVTQVLALRPAPAAQAADQYARASVDVGRLWDGYDGSGRHNTALPDRVLHEPSGLASSRINPEVAYVHSESDVAGMVAVSTRDARVLGKFDLAIPRQWDWEDIATGPCPAGRCIFAGDIGRVNGKPSPPSTFSVYRVAEPDLAAGRRSGQLAGDWFRFRYPDAPHDAEALVVHPLTGRIYVITKEQSGRSGVYAFPADLPAPSATTITTLSKVATLRVPTWTGRPGEARKAALFARVTAAAAHPSGTRLLVRTVYDVYEYRGTSFEAALESSPVALTAPAGEGQGEAIDYAPDGSAYYTVGERPAAPYTLKRVDRR